MKDLRIWGLGSWIQAGSNQQGCQLGSWSNNPSGTLDLASWDGRLPAQRVEDQQWSASPPSNLTPWSHKGTHRLERLAHTLGSEPAWMQDLRPQILKSFKYFQRFKSFK